MRIWIALLLLFVSASGWADTKNPFIGYWIIDFDEDSTPPDTMEIRADGTYVSHGVQCRTTHIFPYHLNKGDLYAEIEIPNKGPISIVYRMNKDGRLSFTSPRTRNNAYYRKLAKNPCP
jgi:sugar lactone lactonase YvrE